MKINKSSLIAVGLATGLSFGSLSGCGSSQFSHKNTIVNPSPTSSSSSAVNQQDILLAKKQLQAVQAKLDELKTFTDGIKVEADGTIVTSTPIDYSEAQQKVKSVADAYEGFKALPQTKKIQQKIIEFDEINQSIERLLRQDSQASKIIASLAEAYLKTDSTNGNYRNAQSQLSKFTIYGVPIYDANTISGQDRPGQKLATKGLLTYTLETLKPKIKTLITEISALSPTGESSIIPQGSENTVQHNASSGGNSVNYGWLLPLLNTTTLLVVIAILLLLFNKNKIDKAVSIDNPPNEKYDSEGKAESPKLVEDISKINSTIVGIRQNLSLLRFFNQFGKNQLTSQDIRTITQKLEDIKIKLEELKNINMDEISVSSKVNPPGDMEFSSHLDNNEVEQASLDVKFGEFQVTLDKTLQKLDKKLEGFVNDINGLIVSTEQSDSSKGYSSKMEIISKFNNIETMLSALTSEIQTREIQAISFPLKVEQKLNAIGNTIITMSKDINGLKESFGNIVEDVQNQLQKNIEYINSISVHSDSSQLIEEMQGAQSKYDLLNAELEEKNRLIEEMQGAQSKYDLLNAELEEKNRLIEDIQGAQSKYDLLNAELEEKNRLIEEMQGAQSKYDLLNAELEEKVKREEEYQSHERTHIPAQWQSLIDAYRHKPENIFNCAGTERGQEVNEDDEKYAERRGNTTKPVILNQNNSPNGYYIVILGADYLLFPKQQAIPESQKDTAVALFEGYKSGNIKKFILVSPAQVTPHGHGMWKLKHKGQLEYT